MVKNDGIQLKANNDFDVDKRKRRRNAKSCQKRVDSSLLPVNSLRSLHIPPSAGISSHCKTMRTPVDGEDNGILCALLSGSVHPSPFSLCYCDQPLGVHET